MLNRRFIILSACASMLALTACNSSDPHADHDMGSQGALGKTLMVENANITPPLPGRNIALGTFVLNNMTAQDDVLLSVSSPISDRIELHTTTRDGNKMSMRRLERVVVPAGEKVVFKRGGYHLMIFGAQMPAADKTVQLSLTFEKAGTISSRASVGSDMKLKIPDHSGH